MYCSHLVVQWSIGDPSRTRLLHVYTWWQCLHHFMQYDSFIIIIIFMLSLTLSLSLWLLSSLSRCSYWFAFAPCFIRNSITIFNRSMQFTSVSTQMRTNWLQVLKSIISDICDSVQSPSIILWKLQLIAFFSRICSTCNPQFTVFNPVIHFDTLFSQKHAHNLFVHSFYFANWQPCTYLYA